MIGISVQCDSDVLQTPHVHSNKLTNGILISTMLSTMSANSKCNLAPKYKLHTPEL